MSFDLLAPHYRWMEWVLAGSKLQRCRTAFLHEVTGVENVLLLGEGNGRFLSALLEAHPGVKCTCVDGSARMLRSAQARLRAQGLLAGSVRFVHANALDWTPPERAFDLIASHFFLDCFRAEQLNGIVTRIASGATPGARWLLADFCEPPAGWMKWRARLILWTMYEFFRVVTRLPAGRLTPPDALLAQNGFVLRRRQLFDWGLLHSDLWESLARN